MTITRALLLALHAHNSGVQRARDDYATNPTRACGWRYNAAERCDDLRDTDNYYCPRHRRARDEMHARQRARKEAA